MNPLRSFLGKAQPRKTKLARKTNRFAPNLEPLDDRIVPTHFRYGNLNWKPTDNPTDSARAVHFDMTTAWRTDYGFNVLSGASNTVGSIISTGDTLNFGDTSGASVAWKVLSVNPTENWIVTQGGTYASGVFTAGFDHTYAATQSYTAFMTNCCRISTLKGGANDKDYRIETVVNAGSGNSSPLSSLAPIVQVQDNTQVSFQIPGFDPDNDAVTYRLATAAEWGAPSMPSGLTVNSTGLVSWNLLDSGGTATNVGDLWALQVMLEDRTGGPTGTVKSKVPVDFILQVVANTNAAPVVSANPTGPFQPVAGQTINFTVTATDANALDTITALQALNAPSGMTFGAITGTNPAFRTVSWTPTQAQANQNYVITFQATDNNGATGTTSVTISPTANLAPTADGGGDYDVNEGGTVQLTATGSDPEGLPLTYAWDLDDNGTYETPGQTVTYSAAGLDGFLGAHRHAPVRVTDSIGNTAFSEAHIFVNNVAPSLNNLSVTSTINENGTVTLAGNYSDPGVPDTHTLTINWGEGSPQVVPVIGGSFSITHQYLDDTPTNTASDNYSIGVSLADDDGGTATGSVSTTVNNVAPVLLTLNATSTINENGTVTLSGTYSETGTQDTHTLTINWGEGAPQVVTVSGGTFSVTHKYLDDNPTATASDNYTISVTLADDDGGSDTDSTTTTITNVAPTFDAGNNESLVPAQGGAFSRTGIAFTDPGTLDSWSGTVDYGDGLGLVPLVVDPVFKTFSLGHTYTAAGTYTVTVTLNDDDGGQNSDNFQVTVVLNEPPTVDADFASVQTPEGTSATNSGTFGDPQGNGTVTLSASVGTVVKNPNGTWTWSGPAVEGPGSPIPVTITATDLGGMTATANFTYSVLNVAPTITSISATSANENGTVTLSGTFSDPGTQDTHTLTINWGEGAPQTVSVSGGTFSVTRQYLDDNPTGTASDNYSIGVSLADDDGGTDTDSTTTTITNVAPVLSTLTATPTINEDGTVTLSGTYGDVGTQDTHTLTINWGEGAPQVVSVSGGTFSVTHKYLDDNPTGTAGDNYSIGVTLTDDDGGTATGSTGTTVNNVAPVIGTLTVATPDSGNTFSLTGTFTDLGKSDTHTAMINWGDGSPATPAVVTVSNGVGTINATHVYGAGSVFTVTVTLTDDDTGTVVGTTKAFNYYVGPQLIAVSRFVSSTSSMIDWISPTGAVLWTIPVPSQSLFGVPQVAGVTDRNGDGVADVYIGSQAGLLNRVGLVDGKTGALLWNAAPYVSTLKLGVNVAVGDLNGDRRPELVVAPAGAATPNVRAFQQTAGSPTFAYSMIRDFYAYSSTFTGGVNVAVGDVNGDGLGDIVTGTASLSDNVRVFSAGIGTSMIADFFAFKRTGVIPGYVGGVSVATGDVNGDNFADLITSTQTQYSRVRVYSGGVNAGLANTPNTLLLDFTTFAANIGTLVMARDLNGDGISEVVTLTQTVGSVLINAYGYTGTLAPSTLMTKAYNYKPSAVRLG